MQESARTRIRGRRRAALVGSVAMAAALAFALPISAGASIKWEGTVSATADYAGIVPDTPLTGNAQHYDGEGTATWAVNGITDEGLGNKMLAYDDSDWTFKQEYGVVGSGSSVNCYDPAPWFSYDIDRWQGSGARNAAQMEEYRYPGANPDGYSEEPFGIRVQEGKWGFSTQESGAGFREDFSLGVPAGTRQIENVWSHYSNGISNFCYEDDTFEAEEPVGRNPILDCFLANSNRPLPLIGNKLQGSMSGTFPEDVPDAVGACADFPGSWSLSYDLTVTCTTPGERINRVMECTPCEYDQWSIDTDGDGLPDGAESGPADLDCDGDREIDLSAMGADPQHKDLFIEIDAMEGFSLRYEAVNDVVDAFARAPVGNPDGEQGINLHVDNGPVSTMNRETGQTWGTTGPTASQSTDDLTFSPVLGTESGGDYDWSEFDALKAIDPERERAFRYVISANRYGSATQDSSGLARGIPGGDMIVSLGSWSQHGTRAQQAGTLMHELGHLIGLRHGGVDDINEKPNYLSIMNYDFQLSHLPRVPGTAGPTLDYSRFDSSDLASLNENGLDELAGFGVSNPQVATYTSVYRCPDPDGPDGPTKAELRRVGTVGSIDWNCDGTNEASVFANVNGDVGGFGAERFSTLESQDDWSNLKFTGGGVGSYGGAADLPDPPVQTLIIEPPKETLEALEQANQGPIVDGTAPPGGGGGGTGGGGGATTTPATPAATTPATTAKTCKKAKKGAVAAKKKKCKKQ